MLARLPVRYKAIMENPRLSPNILLSPVENGYIAYDAALDRLHELNPVAALIAELCDGERNMTEVRDLAAPFVPSDKKTMKIDKWIEGAVRGRASGAQRQRQHARQGDGRRGAVGSFDAFARPWQGSDRVSPCPARGSNWPPMTRKPGVPWPSLPISWAKGNLPGPHRLREISDGQSGGRRSAPYPDRAARRKLRRPACRMNGIQQLYRKFSAFYETNMVDTLEYQAPQRHGELLKTVLGERAGLRVLDLRCACTGLSGLSLNESAAAHLTGVDLSPEMVEKARARAIYDRLDVAELDKLAGARPGSITT